MVLFVGLFKVLEFLFEFLAKLITEAKEIILSDGSERVTAFAGGIFR